MPDGDWKTTGSAKMLLNVCVFITFCVYSASSISIKLTPQKSQYSVAVGSSLQVNCTSTNAVEWKSNANVSISTQGRVVNVENISTLNLDDVQLNQQGTYRCMDTITKDEATFNLNVFKVNVTEANYVYREDTVLQCQVADTTRQFTYKWMKGEKDVRDIKVENKEQYVVHDNGTLEILHPSRSFAGLYTCVATSGVGTADELIVRKDVHYYATPMVIPFEKSKNLVQDENLVIECSVLGYPKPEVFWFRDGEEIKVADNNRFKLLPADTYDGQRIENGKLELRSVDFDDEGDYMCLARQGRWPDFNSTEMIEVRVKDKLAALWPFLGIVAEVVILCTGIFIYEKKRNKDAAEEEEQNQSGGTPEKKSENVRHRGNPNNPRA